MKEHHFIGPFVGFMLAGGVVILDHFNQILAAFVGVLSIVGLIYSIKIKSITLRDARIVEAVDELKLCDECRSGKVPSECPLPPERRPVSCPKRYQRSWWQRVTDPFFMV